MGKTSQHWYCFIDGAKNQPISEDMIKTLLRVNGIFPDTLVRQSKLDEWRPLSSHPRLAEVMGIRLTPLPASDHNLQILAGESSALGRNTSNRKKSEHTESSKENYFLKHWRGNNSLAWAWWVNGLLANILLLMLVQFIKPDFNGPWFLLFSIIIGILFYLWQFVGTCRSADKAISNAQSQLPRKSAFWPRAAIFMLAIGLMSNGSIYVPLIRDVSTLISLEDSMISQQYSLEYIGSTDVLLSGYINRKSVAAVKDAFNSSPQRRVLILNSPGGVLSPAFELADFIVSRELTVVAKNSCASACVLLVAASPQGTALSNAKIVFHHPESRADFVSSSMKELFLKEMNEYYRRFEEYGIPPANLNKYKQTSMTPISLEEAYETSIITLIIDEKSNAFVDAEEETESGKTVRLIENIGLSLALKGLVKEMADVLPQKINENTTFISIAWAENPPSIRYLVEVQNTAEIDIVAEQIVDTNYLCSTESLSVFIGYGVEISYSYRKPDGTILGVTRTNRSDCGPLPYPAAPLRAELVAEEENSSAQYALSEPGIPKNLLTSGLLFFGAIGSLLIGIAVFRREPKVKAVDTEGSKMETEWPEKPKIKLLDRGSIHGTGLIEAIKSGHSKTFQYSGRSSRSEFWWFTFYSFIPILGVMLLIPIMETSLGDLAAIAFGCYLLWIALIYLSLMTRRFHDIGYSAIWTFFYFLTAGISQAIAGIGPGNLLSIMPLFLPLLFFIPWCKPGQSADNEYGSNPLKSHKESSSSEGFKSMDNFKPQSQPIVSDMPPVPDVTFSEEHVAKEYKESEPMGNENQKIKLLDRWSIRGALLGFAMGVFQMLNMGYTSITFMIGFGIPYAMIFGLIGLVVDFFRFRRRDQ